MAADTSKITVVCPTCDNKMEIPGEKKNTRLECPKCGGAFMAYEAVKCEKCGSFRHPEHPCWQCFPDNDDARAYRERRKRDLLDRLPELWDGMAERIEELEERIADLESELEELKKKEDGE